MTIQEAINKAVAGGYHIRGSDGMDTYYEGANSEFSAWTRTDNESSFMVPTEETFLDPKFWQALGRIFGWSEVCDLALLCVYGEEEGQWSRGYYWMYQWHCFIQALADGKTPETFFAHLPASQRMSHGNKNRHQVERQHSLARASQRVLEIQETLHHICESAQRAWTQAHSVQQTAQAIQVQCRYTRYLRTRIRQVLYGNGDCGRESPEKHPHA